MSQTAESFLEYRRRKIAPFLILSLIIHILLFLLAAHFKPFATTFEPDIPVELVQLPPTKEAPEARDRRVVDLPKNTPDLQPKDADFLSDRNSSVDKEMKKIGPRAKSSPAAPPAEPSPAAESTEPAKAEQSFDSPEIDEGSYRPNLPENPGDRLAALMPSSEAIADVASRRSQAYACPDCIDEYLPQTMEGFETKLNAVYFEHATFINRMKTAIKSRWTPLADYRREDPQGKRLTKPRYETAVVIKLDSSGGLIEVVLFNGSGKQVLDQAFVDAINTAAPFPHPPQKLVSPDGVIYLPFVGAVILEPQTMNFNFSAPRRR